MNNKYPQTKFIFDRRKTASLTTKSSVELRITYNYKQRYISTGIMLYSNQWKGGKIVNCSDLLQISQTLDKLIRDVRQIILDMMEKGIDISAIADELKRKNNDRISFYDFCDQRASISVIPLRLYGIPRVPYRMPR